jgi:hypothetical protein
MLQRFLCILVVVVVVVAPARMQVAAPRPPARPVDPIAAIIDAFQTMPWWRWEKEDTATSRVIASDSRSFGTPASPEP